jgi:hypothetical protein
MYESSRVANLLGPEILSDEVLVFFKKKRSHFDEIIKN